MRVVAVLPFAQTWVQGALSIGYWIEVRKNMQIDFVRAKQHR